uniref:Uncharacterized protein n=1 Tax=Ditylum brightwellii TaxID=49249 RepID=A0A7S4SRT0_9STRA
MRPCSSTHQSRESNFQPYGPTPDSIKDLASRNHTPRGPGSTVHNPQFCAPVPWLVVASPNAAMNCVGMRRNAIASSVASWALAGVTVEAAVAVVTATRALVNRLRRLVWSPAGVRASP